MAGLAPISPVTDIPKMHETSAADAEEFTDDEHDIAREDVKVHENPNIKKGAKGTLKGRH